MVYDRFTSDNSNFSLQEDCNFQLLDIWSFSSITHMKLCLPQRWSPWELWGQETWQIYWSRHTSWSLQLNYLISSTKLKGWIIWKLIKRLLLSRIINLLWISLVCGELTIFRPLVICDVSVFKLPLYLSYHLSGMYGKPDWECQYHRKTNIDIQMLQNCGRRLKKWQWLQKWKFCLSD